MPGLLAQCNVGLIALDPRHKTHNIPGKFLTYLLAGLPVLARVNAGTDLAQLIEKEGVGKAYVGDLVEVFANIAEDLADNAVERDTMAARGYILANRMFSSDVAVHQIVSAALTISNH